ncbi:DNA modification methylase [Rhodoligotrophos appendicifer]|uniref:site-specific DNA-methyltransferase n=1 Tax=Rhodoligotrophos appendicifer TaxID=987056 RepID=UPI001184A38C|nr:site-specific DNA-methyltransferase [Rhodoligotrophos appendicifer]
MSGDSKLGSAERALSPERLRLETTDVPVEAIKTYARNARRHTRKQVEQIAESIRAFGFVSPLLIDEQGVIIAGHGRLAAAKKLGYSTVPVVRVEHLDDAQKRALRIADNKLCELAGWDEELLKLEFSDLLKIDLRLDLSFDLEITGFASAEIDRLVNDSAEDPDDDKSPELPAQAPVTRPGDLWILGGHRLICGDALEEATYEKLMGEDTAQMSISDPPYNVPIGGHVSRTGRHRAFAMASGEMSEDEFTRFLQTYLTHATKRCDPAAIHLTFIDWRHMREMLNASRQAELELKNLVVWDKGSGAMGSFYRSQHELAFIFKSPGASHKNNVQLGKFGRNRTNVWSYPGAHSLRKELELHPTPKPVALIADAIRDVSDRNNLVLDCFAGSGTTIIAAEKVGRRCRAIELDPGYVDVAVKRWLLRTGETAIHADTGLSFADRAKQMAGKPSRIRRRPTPFVLNAANGE